MTLIAFDIECAQWDRFVCGAAVHDDGRVYVFYTVEDVRDWYSTLDKNDLIIAHNGGRYDILFLIDAIRSEWIGSTAGSGIVSARAKGGPEIRDSYRLFPLSLAAWTGAKDSTGLECECGKGCGGYCAIRVDLPRAKVKRLAEYCVNDCRILLDAYKRSVIRAAEEGWKIYDSKGLPRRTMGTVAWETARKICDIDPTPIEWPEHDATRVGCYGGRTEVYKTRSWRGHRHDINSAYSHALTQPVPIGSPSWLEASDAAVAFGYTGRPQPGIYEATVAIADTLLPTLPHRVNERVIWSTGIVRGHWSHVELLHALLTGECEVIEWHGAIVYEDERAVFKRYVNWGYDLRIAARAAGDEAWDAWIKWPLNGVTGKLYQQPEATTLRVRPAKPERGWRWLGGDCFESVSRRIAPNCRPHWAATLTARTRCQLFDRLHAAGDARVYADTDSSISERYDDTDESQDELGGWKYEGTYVPWIDERGDFGLPGEEVPGWHAVAPKLYDMNGIDLKGKVKHKTKAKGIPRPDSAAFGMFMLPDSEADMEIEGRPVTCDVQWVVQRDVGVDGVKSAVRRHGRAFVARVVERGRHQSLSVAGTRYVMQDGTTLPLRRDADGTYRWPGCDASPDTFLSGLT